MKDLKKHRRQSLHSIRSLKEKQHHFFSYRESHNFIFVCLFAFLWDFFGQKRSAHEKRGKTAAFQACKVCGFLLLLSSQLKFAGELLQDFHNKTAARPHTHNFLLFCSKRKNGLSDTARSFPQTFLGEISDPSSALVALVSSNTRPGLSEESAAHKQNNFTHFGLVKRNPYFCSFLWAKRESPAFLSPCSKWRVSVQKTGSCACRG